MKFGIRITRWHLIGALTGLPIYWIIAVALAKLSPNAAALLFGIIMATVAVAVILNLVISYRRDRDKAAAPPANIWIRVMFWGILLISGWLFYKLYIGIQQF